MKEFPFERPTIYYDEPSDEGFERHVAVVDKQETFIH